MVMKNLPSEKIESLLSPLWCLVLRKIQNPNTFWSNLKHAFWTILNDFEPFWNILNDFQWIITHINSKFKGLLSLEIAESRDTSRRYLH